MGKESEREEPVGRKNVNCTVKREKSKVGDKYSSILEDWRRIYRRGKKKSHQY